MAATKSRQTGMIDVQNKIVFLLLNIYSLETENNLWFINKNKTTEVCGTDIDDWYTLTNKWTHMEK